MRLDGRIAIVTGAGRGLGRAHAKHLATLGAAVVVNDRGGSVSGEGSDRSSARQVAEEIVAAGGRAIVSTHDVADWREAAALIDVAVTGFGGLDVLVNNAGILRDRTLANMSEAEWDAVVRVHLKGHAAPTRHALAYWRSRYKRGEPVRASVVHTSSVSGLCGNFGQANYASAKLAVVALSSTVALEAGRYGVRSNVVSPSARTRITEAVVDADPSLAPPEDPGAFDRLAPENVSPMIAWLAGADCPANAQIFHVIGRDVFALAIPTIVHRLRAPDRWTEEALDTALRDRLVRPLPIERFVDDEADA